MEKLWQPKSKTFLFILSFSICIFFLSFLQLSLKQFQPLPYRLQMNESPEEARKGFLIKTSGCKIPDLDPYDQVVKKYVYKEQKIKCDYSKPPLVDSNSTHIFIVNESISHYASNYSELRCCYKSFWRVEPEEGKKDKGVAKYSKNCVAFNNTVEIFDEYIGTICEVDGEDVYEDYFPFVPTKKTTNPHWNKKPLNVLFIGIDSLSRLNFLRQMPNTYKFLKKIGAYEFMGFNKVADNTFPNLMPLLTGYTAEEIEKNCWNKSTYFDNCPFVWKEYSKAGFLTSFAEDVGWMGLFQYQKKGFQKQPTDYYWTFFDLIVSRLIGNTPSGNVKLCMGNRFVYNILCDYIWKSIERFRNSKRPYFGIFWSNSMSHDYLNRPNLMDNDYFRLLQKMNENGYLEDTVIIVNSDHGIRWGPIRSTYQGMLEERLPLLFIRLPEWFKAKYSKIAENLKTNTRRLVTQFDIYETLKDLVKPYDIKHKKLTSFNSKRGYSLFDEVPENRTCESASIASHWCTCQTSVSVDVNNTIVENVSEYAVDYMNALLKNYPSCVKLTLGSILSARVQKHSDTIHKGEDAFEDYTVNLRTEPNSALYEVTVRDKHNKNGQRTFEITGTISRVNLYSDQSRCISDFKMKLYCFCKEFLH